MRLYTKILLNALFCLFITTMIFNDAHAQVIMIDPGHGYTSTGGDPDGRTATEHETALAVGLKLRTLLQDGCSSWTVRMTRTKNIGGWISLSQRRAMSNDWRADRFLSIHCNGGGGTGTETFWCNQSNSSQSANTRFSNQVQNRMVEKGDWFSRRVAEDNTYLNFHLGVLRGNNAIGCLNEIGFVDSGDKSKLLNDTWRQRFAEAYYIALQNDVGGNCTPPAPEDTTPPTTAISAVGGTTQTGDFTVNFTDSDNIGVTRKFYQVLEKVGSDWLANRGNGFFNDNYKSFYSGYDVGTGSWTISNEHLLQSNTTTDNAKLSTYLSQNSGLPYLYQFSAKVLSTSGPKKFGLHIMSDDASQEQRGNSYLIWFSGAENKVRLYETVNNQLYSRSVEDLPADNNWADYKITYSPAYGVLEVFKNNQSVLKWTDSSPISGGSYISYRTNQTSVEFDDLKVYKFRGSSTTVTAGADVTKDARQPSPDGTTATCKVKSLVRDAACNWSSPGNLDVVLNFNSVQSLARASGIENVIFYPNPTDGQNLSLNYTAAAEGVMNVKLLDINGKEINTYSNLPVQKGANRVDLQTLMEEVPSGQYIININNGDDIRSTKIIKQ